MSRLGIAALVAILTAPSAADAFCGFYIDTNGSEMVNNATQVVLMRDGTRTVLSMQNNYQGPPSDFAMVVPVPVVLQQSDVMTLPKAVFAKVDAMSSPRLVEYWEHDPCAPEEPERKIVASRQARLSVGAMKPAAPGDYGVTVEAQFEVGEYKVVILSAKESTGLERYLRDQHYKIPASAESLLRPYVVGGSKFFVAKVDPKKVRFEHGQARLSPLRFHYDSEDFSLPIRLGLANSAGTQDLIVNILARGQRFELANYQNVTIPTNFDVKDDVRVRFGEFYAALFDRTVQQHPGAVVTEYSWDASSCDPCPGPMLDSEDFETLGATVLDSGPTPASGRNRRVGPGGAGFVLTRLHARYGKADAPNDLVFKEAPPIAGGREQRDASGKLEHGFEPARVNNFQGRYAIRHPWTGTIACDHPVRGRWGEPPAGNELATGPKAATDIAFAPRGNVQLPMLVLRDLPEIGLQQGVPFPAPTPPLPGGARLQAKPQGCGCESGSSTGIAAFAGILLAVLRRRRTRG